MEKYSFTLIRFCIAWEEPLILLLNRTIINIYFFDKKTCLECEKEKFSNFGDATIIEENSDTIRNSGNE